MSDTETIMKMVNEDSEYYRIARYIMDKHEDYENWFTLEEAKKVAKYLILEKNFQNVDILNGKADNEINKQYLLKLTKQNSIAKTDELVPEIALKTIKKFLDNATIRRILAGTLAITASAAIVNSLTSSLEEAKMTRDVTNSIAMLSSSYGSSDYIHKINIAQQGEYVVDYDYDKNEAVVAYHYDMIAKDIMDVCKKDINLFDVVIYNTYFNMNYERLRSMDQVWDYLKLYFSKDEAFTPLYESIKDCDVFLDYLVKKGFVNMSDPNYNQVLQDVARYKKVGNFNSLNEEEQKRIMSLIETYEESKMNLYSTYQERLNELTLETESGVSR